jgi:hypothetical protein
VDADEDARVPIAWNDIVDAFEAVAVWVGARVGKGMAPLEAFERAEWVLGVPEAYRDRFWRIAVPVIAEADLAAGRRPSLVGADLSGVDLSEGDLRGFDLAGANLAEADLAGALLDGADLSGADLAGADLEGASFAGAVMPDGTVTP